MAQQRSQRAFGVKDLFTLVNVLGGVVALVFVLEGDPLWAGYALIAGFLLGDSLDGHVARATGTGNRFGAEFDGAADGLTQCFVPALIVYVAYDNAGHPWLGATIMGALVVAGTLRQARLAVESFQYSLCYCGLPRTISGFLAMAYANSTLILPELGYVVGAAVLIPVAFLGLAPVPYMTHKGRKLQLPVKLMSVLFVVLLPVFFAFKREWFFDFLALCSALYVLFGWTWLRRDEIAAFYVEYRRWSLAVASKK